MGAFKHFGDAGSINRILYKGLVHQQVFSEILHMFEFGERPFARFFIRAESATASLDMLGHRRRQSAASDPQRYKGTGGQRRD